MSGSWKIFPIAQWLYFFCIAYTVYNKLIFLNLIMYGWDKAIINAYSWTAIFALNQMTKLVFTFDNNKKKTQTIRNHTVFIQILSTIMMKSTSLV